MLYVGISKHALARFHEHSREKGWWDLVERVAVEHFPSRRAAEDAEARSIRAEGPRYNIAHAAKRAPERDGQSKRIDWACDVCGSPVKDGGGWISVLFSDVEIHKRGKAEYENRRAEEIAEAGTSWTPLNLAHVLDLPDRAQWRVLHRLCDDDQEAYSYWFDIDRCRTEAHLIHWTAHLMGKGWLKHTDWAEFLRKRGAYA